MIEEYRGVDPRRQSDRDILKDIDKALAWGLPGKESIGYSMEELLGILKRAAKRIKDLEKINLKVSSNESIIYSYSEETIK
jgi:hypothetical protein